MSGKDSGKTYSKLKDEIQSWPEVIQIQVTGEEEDSILSINLLIHQVDPQQKRQLVKQVIECAGKRGVTIDEGQVTLACLEPQAAESEGGTRAAIDEILVRRAENMIEAEVRLNYRGIKYTGKHKGVDRNPFRLRVAGEATLNALQQMLPADFKLVLTGVRKIIIEEAEALVSLVEVLNSGREFKFAGIALNESGDETNTVVRAILAALNRFLASSIFN